MQRLAAAEPVDFVPVISTLSPFHPGERPVSTASRARTACTMGTAVGAAAQLGQDAPSLEGGYGAFAVAADAGVAGVDLTLVG